MSSTWPPSWICSAEFGKSRFMILASASGMIGSSLPATIRVGRRTSGSMKTLVHPAPASSWCIYPTREPAIS
jgi:hypothetical protein